MKDKTKIKGEKKERRHKRVRAKIKGSASCPRLSVFRSNKHITCQLIDDEKRRTIAQSGDSVVKTKKKSTKTESAFEVGKKLAEMAKEKKIKTVVFDKGGYIFHGRVKSLAEGARKGGLQF